LTKGKKGSPRAVKVK